VLETLKDQLAASNHLSDEQVRAAVECLLDEKLSPEIKADFLQHLALKGETVHEIIAFVEALRKRAVEPPIQKSWRESHEILDVCGTGGDRLNTFNISTTVAIVCAAAGVPVAKHGNRAITSQAGSADVLEALGIRIDLPPDEAAASLQERNFAFFFAPRYHPSFKHIAPARKLSAERGQRTIFNFLGPLLNPARPAAQLVGVPRPELCEPLARVLQSVGVRRAMVVCGRVHDDEERFLDELSTLGDNSVAEFYQERGFATSTLSPHQFPINDSSLDDLLGGDRDANAEIVRRLLEGKERGPKREAILLNTAAGLMLAGKARTLSAGWDLGAEVIDNGSARLKLEELAKT
jgi:anthranilate phosphoribosyltransferase